MRESISVNLRVSAHCSQGGRNYMEDTLAVAYQRTADGKDFEYAYFGIFDGHGGREAAMFAKKHLLKAIVKQKNFWSKNDEDVLKAIKDGFMHTHLAMWKDLGNWPKTSSGLPSTAGTTASIAFIKKGKLYTGHVGDSAIVLGFKEPGSKEFGSQRLTRDHKPGSPSEKQRIENLGGCVMSKSGVQRVVWNRPRVGHQGPVRRSTHIDRIPFLAVARSLGDLWSYNYEREEFIVSPEPDVSVMTIDTKRDRCIILGTDGLWNMIISDDAALSVQESEIKNDQYIISSLVSPSSDPYSPLEKPPWINPSKILVEKCLLRWKSLQMRADNTSVVTVMIDAPGPPRIEVLQRQYLMTKLRPREEVERDDSKNLVYDILMNASSLHDVDEMQPKNKPYIRFDSDKTRKSIVSDRNRNPETSNSSCVQKKHASSLEDFSRSSVGKDALVDKKLFSSVHTNQSDEDIAAQKVKGMKRKNGDSFPSRMKLQKSEKHELDRTCEHLLPGYSKPCTRSSICCS